MMLAPIRNWILCGAGYMQTQGDTNQGIPALTHYLHNRYASDTCRVEFCTWNHDWAGLAEWIFRTSRNGLLPRILIVNYSWCVGFGLPRLLGELRYRLGSEFRVAAAVLCDGVYHLGGRLLHKIPLAQLAAYLPAVQAVRKLLGQAPLLRRQKIVLPRLIEETHWFVQDNFRWNDMNTWLRGHELVWEDGQSVPGRIDIQGRTHRWMDECLEFKGRVLEVAERLFATAA